MKVIFAKIMKGVSVKSDKFTLTVRYECFVNGTFFGFEQNFDFKHDFQNPEQTIFYSCFNLDEQLELTAYSANPNGGKDIKIQIHEELTNKIVKTILEEFQIEGIPICFAFAT